MKNIFIAIFFVSFCAFSQTSNKSVLAKYTDDEIKIDGVLNEAAWGKVLPATNFHEYFPSDTAQARDKLKLNLCLTTEIYMLV